MKVNTLNDADIYKVALTIPLIHCSFKFCDHFYSMSIAFVIVLLTQLIGVHKDRLLTHYTIFMGTTPMIQIITAQ